MRLIYVNFKQRVKRKREKAKNITKTKTDRKKKAQQTDKQIKKHK